MRGTRTAYTETASCVVCGDAFRRDVRGKYSAKTCGLQCGREEKKRADRLAYRNQSADQRQRRYEASAKHHATHPESQRRAKDRWYERNKHAMLARCHERYRRRVLSAPDVVADPAWAEIRAAMFDFKSWQIRLARAGITTTSAEAETT